MRPASFSTPNLPANTAFLIWTAGLIALAAAADAPKVFTAQDGQFPWYDCLNVHSIAGLPAAMSGTASLPRQDCGNRALSIPGQPKFLIQPKSGAGIPYDTFAREIIGADPVGKVGLVRCAVGGTPLSRWVKGAGLYEKAVARTRAAMAFGTLEGMQGGSPPFQCGEPVGVRAPLRGSDAETKGSGRCPVALRGGPLLECSQTWPLIRGSHL